MTAANKWPAERIQALRARTGLSLERFAALLGVSWQTVRQWERGTQSVSLVRCADALAAVAKKVGPI